MEEELAMVDESSIKERLEVGELESESIIVGTLVGLAGDRMDADCARKALNCWVGLGFEHDPLARFQPLNSQKSKDYYFFDVHIFCIKSKSPQRLTHPSNAFAFTTTQQIIIFKI